MPVIIIAVILILINTIYVRNYKRIRNLKYKIEVNKSNNKFCRDINVDYSPSIVSYLYNQKIELKKDLISDILNLYARKIIDIKTKENNQYEIIVDKEKYEELYWKNKLFENDRYILNTIVLKRFNFKYEEWQNKIKNVYRQILMESKNNKENEDKDSEILRIFLKLSSVFIVTIIILSIILRYRVFNRILNMYYGRIYNVNIYSVNKKNIK